jgi:beta-N-acetylhexosaminidase
VALALGSGPAPAAPEVRDRAAGAPSSCVTSTLAELTPTQRAGQLVMVGVPAGAPDSERTTVSDLRLGGAFLAGRSTHSPATVRAGVRRLAGQTTSGATIGLFIATDQEGGLVQTLHGGSWSTIPKATVQGTYSAAKLASRWTTWAGQLADAGLNMDLAPVADTVPKGRERSNPPIGNVDREYGTDSVTVRHAVATVSGAMSRTGIIPTVKHFPGLGRVYYNTDTSTKAVDSITSATSAYLKPFSSGVAAGAGAVMVSSARYPKIDAKNLAVFSSPVITGLLRGRLGYQGVVMTDDVGRAVAVRSVPTGERATRFIAAGGDVVLTVDPARALSLIVAIKHRDAADAAFRAKVSAAVTRVLTLKEQRGLLTCA